MFYGYILNLNNAVVTDNIPQTLKGTITIENNHQTEAFSVGSGTKKIKFSMNGISIGSGFSGSLPIHCPLSVKTREPSRFGGGIYSTIAIFDGPVKGSSFTATSSRTKKTNIEPYEGKALDLIKSTDIVSYTYKNDPTETKYVGFISEDTPSPLSTEDKLNMSVNSCIGILLKAVQELDKKIEEMKHE